MTQTQLNHYDSMPTRERMTPRKATKQAARASAETAHRDKKRYKKGVDRCERIGYYLEQ